MSDEPSTIKTSSFAHSRRAELPGSQVADTDDGRAAFERARTGHTSKRAIPEPPRSAALPAPGLNLPEAHPSFALPARKELSVDPSSASAHADDLKQAFLRARQHHPHATKNLRRAR